MQRVAGLFALCLMLLAMPAQAQRNNDLTLLGEQAVGFGVDRDVIKIGQSEDWFRNRTFKALHFAAERNDLHMVSIRIVYLNGHTEDIKVDKQIRPGRQLVVDLRGDKSYLRQIEMVYRSRPSFKGQAVIKVYGEASKRRHEPKQEWLLLGEKSVGFLVDRDVINISRSEDWFRNHAFRELQFVTENNDVHMLGIRIVYINGHTENVKVDKLIRAGGHLTVDLKGEKSFLRRIEMTYRARPSFKGQAVIKVYGEPAQRGRR